MTSVFERARSYVGKMPVSVAGANGHAAAFEVAAVLVKGFSLPLDQAAQLFAEWNAGCRPPWAASELQHKLRPVRTVPSVNTVLPLTVPCPKDGTR